MEENNDILMSRELSLIGSMLASELEFVAISRAARGLAGCRVRSGSVGGNASFDYIVSSTQRIGSEHCRRIRSAVKDSQVSMIASNMLGIRNAARCRRGKH